MKKTNPRLSLPAAALLWFAAASAHAQNTEPVRDINTSLAAPAANAASLVKLTAGNQDFLMLSIDDPLAGHELWKGSIQGNAVNFSVVKDIVAGADSSIPRELTPVGNKLFFTTGTGNGKSLWVTNGDTAGTTLLLAPGSNPNASTNPSPSKLIAFKNAANVEQLVFEAYSATFGREIWKSDGTVNGTVRVSNVNGLDISATNFVVDSANSTLYFTGLDPATSREIYKINFSNSAGAVLVKDLAINNTPFPGGFDPGLTLMNNKIYFAADTEPELGSDRTEFWVTDGIVGGITEVVKEIAPAAASSTPRSFKVMTVINAGTDNGTYLFFTADDSVKGRELWRSNGLTGGQGKTELVKDLLTNSNDSSFEDTNWDQLTVVGNTLFFVANSGAGAELHRSSGRITPTTETTQVANIRSGTASSNPRNLTPFDSKLVFSATNDSDNTALYFCTAPTPTSVTLLKDFGASRKVSQITRIGSQLYFLVDDAEIWKTDGATVAGTVMVRNFRSGTSSSLATGLTTNGNEVYFSATDGDNALDPAHHGKELWKTDGTLAGTQLVKDIRPGAESSEPESITAAGNKFFFSADAGNNRELWVTDGTELGTNIVLTRQGDADVEINTAGGSRPEELAYINGALYFSAENTASGREPWKSDGTPAGTQMIANLVDIGSSSDPKEFIEYKEKVYFVSKAALDQRRLRYIDTNPQQVVGLGDAQDVTQLTVFAQKIFFSGKNSNGSFTGFELWSSNGTDAGTMLVRDINPGNGNSNPKELTVAGSSLYFTANNGTNGVELWRTTGTGGGTAMVKDINTATKADSSPQGLTEAGGKLFFTADNGTNGRELWVSNGTGAGTFMLKDIVPGAGSPDIQSMKNIDGVLCFTADDGVNGREMWISDGTTAGTRMVNDFTGPDTSSDPGNFTALNAQLLYTAADRNYGNELRLFPIGDKIQVEQPAGNALAASSTVNFGSVIFKDPVAPSATLIITVRNTGIATLSSIKPLISGINASEFTIVAPKPATSLIQDASTTFGVKFTPKEGGIRSAILSILSSDEDRNPFVITLSGTGVKDPTITVQPSPLMLKVGQSANFGATVTGTAAPLPLSLQWRKGSASIAGALSTSSSSPATAQYSIPAVTLKDAAAYSLFVKGNPASSTALSNSAELGVVEDYPVPLLQVVGLGKTATFKVNAAGNQLTYQWLKNNVPMENDSRIAGVTTKAMTIKGLVGTDTDLYACRVSNPGGSQVGGNTQLNVFSLPPEISLIDNADLPPGIVGGLYSYQVPINPDASKAALSYSAKNLPPGLKINAKTGEITGRPTKATTELAKFDKISITAANTVSKTSFDTVENLEIVIQDYPTGLEGVYAGTVGRDEEINGRLGGRLDLTITKTGAYSGSLMLGATKLALKGSVDIFIASENKRPKITQVLKRPGKPVPEDVTLTVEIDTQNGVFAASNVATASNDTALINGWRQLGTADTKKYLGYYTFGLELGDQAHSQPPLSAYLPQGWSYGSFTVAATGKLAIAGRTADGDKITCASFVGTGGKVVIFQTMYTPLKGSLMGELVIDPQTYSTEPSAPLDTDNTLTGDLDWVRPYDSKSKTRTYIAGFGLPGTPFLAAQPIDSPVPLEAVGSFYEKPVGTKTVFDDDSTSASLTFTEGGIVETALANNPNVNSFTIAASNKITLPTMPSATKLTIAGATGVLGGSFALTDSDLRTGLEAKKLTRKVTFQGIMIKDSLGEFGAGFFTLPERPMDGETPTTVPILGGRVEVNELSPP